MTDGWSREQFARDHSVVLRRVAEGAPIREVLDALARLIERLDLSMKCSVLLLTDDGRHLVSGAAPSLPAEYSQAIDGVPIGDMAGSCGTAAFRREMVIAADIATDPRWAEYRNLALPHGLRACWSTPVFDNTGRVLGTFAAYHGEPHHPTDSQLALVHEATDIAGRNGAVEERADAQAERGALPQARVGHRAGGVDRQDRWHDGGSAQHVAGLHRRHRGGLGRRRLASLGSPDDRDATRVAWIRALATRTSYEIEHRILRADGEWRTMRGHAVPIFEEDGSIREWIGAHTDVTEQRALEVKVRQAQKLESLGVMAGGIAHDFNNLLVGMLANAGLALTDVPSDSPAHECLVAIEAAAGRAADLVGQLLAYTGRGSFLVQPLDLSRLVLEMGGLLATAITKSAMIDYDFAVLEVADSGCGMDAATQARMFEPFFTTKFAGRGLGLAAVQGIVRSHGGAIRIRTTPGKGRRSVWFSRPIRRAKCRRTARVRRGRSLSRSPAWGRSSWSTTRRRSDRHRDD